MKTVFALALDAIQNCTKEEVEDLIKGVKESKFGDTQKQILLMYLEEKDGKNKQEERKDKKKDED